MKPGTTEILRGFAPLPRMHDADGHERRVGVEIEFAGLTEEDTARLAVDQLGGTVEHRAPHTLQVADCALGNLEIELDTALKSRADNTLVDAGLDVARGLIPVEIVTEPLDWTGLDRLDAFRETLRLNGALGTHDGVLMGFGVHFNVSVTAPDDPYTLQTILAFALLEEWLRQTMPIDTTRRLLPFVDRWPEAFVAALAERASNLTLSDVRDAYAEHCNSRNYALDLLPLLKSTDEDAFATMFPRQTNTKARPAFHYRLPDSRIDEATWSLALEWQRWVAVETLADAPSLLASLAEDFLKRDRPILGARSNWADHVADRVGPTLAGLLPATS